MYFDSQEMFGGEGHSYGEELSNHSSDEEDYYDGDGMVSLEEDPPWAPELLHYLPTNALRPKRRRHGRGRRGRQTQVGGTNEDDDGDFLAHDGQTSGLDGCRASPEGGGLAVGELGTGPCEGSGPVHTGTGEHPMWQ
jgi:hypothetical protein